MSSFYNHALLSSPPSPPSQKKNKMHVILNVINVKRMAVMNNNNNNNNTNAWLLGLFFLCHLAFSTSACAPWQSSSSSSSASALAPIKATEIGTATATATTTATATATAWGSFGVSIGTASNRKATVFAATATTNIASAPAAAFAFFPDHSKAIRRAPPSSSSPATATAVRIRPIRTVIPTIAHSSAVRSFSNSFSHSYLTQTKLFAARGDDDEENSRESSKKKDKNWIRRLREREKRTIDDKDDNENENEDTTNTDNGDKSTGIFGYMGKALKRIPARKKDNGGIRNSIKRKINSNVNGSGNTGTDGNKDDDSGGGVNDDASDTFDKSFKSEVALAIEIKRQKALDRYEMGDEIPSAFLPTELLSFNEQLEQQQKQKLKEQSKQSKSLSYSFSSSSTSTSSSSPTIPILDIDKIVSTLDDNIFYMEKQIQLVKMEQRKYTDDLVSMTSSSNEEKRLFRLKRDLETTRKNVILDEQKRRKAISLEERANQERERMAKAREKAKALQQKKQGIGMTKEEAGKDKSGGDSTADEQPKGKGGGMVGVGGVGKNISNAVDGVVSGAQSAFSNAWKTVRKDNNRDEWIELCPKTRISPGEIYPAVAGGVDLLVIGSKDGTKIHCIANTCPHLGTPLETGMIERRKQCQKSNGAPSNSMSTEDDTKTSLNDGYEDVIVCPLHQTAFSLDTGEVNGDWCPYPPVLGKVMGTVKQENKVPTFQMRTRGKNIEIKITSAIDFVESSSAGKKDKN